MYLTAHIQKFHPKSLVQDQTRGGRRTQIPSLLSQLTRILPTTILPL